MIFDLVLVPAIPSRTLRAMHRQVKQFEATDINAARRIVKAAMPDGLDDSGEWFVETIREAPLLCNPDQTTGEVTKP